MIGHFPLRARIFLGFGLLMVLMLGIAAYGSYGLSTVAREIDKLDGIAGNMDRTREMSLLIETVRRGLAESRRDQDATVTHEVADAEARALALLAQSAEFTLSASRRAMFNRLADWLRGVIADQAHFRGSLDAAGAARRAALADADNLQSALDRLDQASGRPGVGHALSAASTVEPSVRLAARAEATGLRVMLASDTSNLARFDGQVADARQKLSLLASSGSPAAGAVASALDAFASHVGAATTADADSAMIFTTRLQPAMLAMQDSLSKSLGKLMVAFDDVDHRAFATASRTLVEQLALSGTATLVGMGVALVLARTIIRPVRGMTAAMVRIANGDVTGEIPGRNFRDVIGEMARSVVVFQRQAVENANYAIIQAKVEEQLTRRAFYDSLTGLPNRQLLHDRIGQAMARSLRRGDMTGLLFIDLDNFKLINDSLGHEAGDQLLVEVAARLLKCVRAEDTVARLGGDEFVVLLEGISSASGADIVANAIVEQLEHPFSFSDRSVSVTASIGVGTADPGQDRAEGLLQKADIAMYRAKERGRGHYVVFDPSMQEDSLGRLELENDLRRAVGNEELRVYYQPIVDMKTTRLVEVEALVRWQHPTRGLIPPLEFIPAAEETGLIVPLGAWVLERACRQVLEWQTSCPVEPPLTLSVNLSPRQFRQAELDRDIADILERTGFDPRCLKLEITEGALMEDFERTVSTLHRLKALGCRLAVDDFGTGYSSLAYLRQLPIDVLKIDRSFVKGLGKNAADTAIVQAIVSLAKSLNLSVTGEGVETANQAATLSDMACDQGQGYFFGRPIAPDGIATLLQQSELEVGAEESASGLETTVVPAHAA